MAEYSFDNLLNPSTSPLPLEFVKQHEDTLREWFSICRLKTEAGEQQQLLLRSLKGHGFEPQRGLDTGLLILQYGEMLQRLDRLNLLQLQLDSETELKLAKLGFWDIETIIRSCNDDLKLMCGEYLDLIEFIKLATKVDCDLERHLEKGSERKFQYVSTAFLFITIQLSEMFLPHSYSYHREGEYLDELEIFKDSFYKNNNEIRLRLFYEMLAKYKSSYHLPEQPVTSELGGLQLITRSFLNKSSDINFDFVRELDACTVNLRFIPSSTEKTIHHWKSNYYHSIYPLQQQICTDLISYARGLSLLMEMRSLGRYDRFSGRTLDEDETFINTFSFTPTSIAFRGEYFVHRCNSRLPESLDIFTKVFQHYINNMVKFDFNSHSITQSPTDGEVISETKAEKFDEFAYIYSAIALLRLRSPAINPAGTNRPRTAYNLLDEIYFKQLDPLAKGLFQFFQHILPIWDDKGLNVTNSNTPSTFWWRQSSHRWEQPKMPVQLTSDS